METTVLEVAHGGERLIVKAGAGSDRHIAQELHAHRHWLAPWTSRGRAPALRHADETAKLLVTTYQPGELVTGDERAEVPANYRQAGELLSMAGHHASAARMPYTTRFGMAAIARWTAGTDDDAELGDRARLQPSIRRHAAVGRLAKKRGLPRNDARERWRAHLQPFFDKHDVVVTPGLARPPLPAVRWGERGWLRNVNSNARTAPFQNAWNLAGYPAIVVPMGLHSTGVPLSVQIAAPYGREATLLGLVRQLEQQAPWPRHAPGFDG